jgi:hypothetical protein
MIEKNESYVSAEEKKHRWMYENLPRWVNCIYAFTKGYFWLPCDCGRYFGGHEWFHGSDVYDGHGSGHGVCPECGKDQARLKTRSAKGMERDEIKVYEIH